MKRHKVTNNWFFSDVPSWAKFCQIYIKGDSLILLPFLIILIGLGFLNFKFMLISLTVFYTLRQMFEVIYWLLQQFSKRDYRPYDFGYKNLDNHAIYVIYQLRCFVGATIGVCALIYLLFFLN